MFLTHTFVAIFVLIGAVYGDQDICTVDGIESRNWIHKSEKVVLDIYEGIIEEFPALNLDSARIENSPYLKAELKDNKIVISTTPAFAEIENREEKVPITATLVTVCAEQESEVQYILEIQDTNNHAPTFEKNVYTFLFYDVIPFTDEFNLNDFEQVAAKDLDKTNEKITFTIENNDYVELGNAGVRDDGDHQRFVAELSLMKQILAPFNRTFVITATDSAEPLQRSTADISIIVLRSQAPTFTKSLYEAYVNDEREIVMKNGAIVLENATQFEDIRIEISEEYDKFFKVNIENGIKLELVEDADPSGLVSAENPTLVVPLYAEGDDPEIYAETAVLIDMESMLESVTTSTTEINQVVTDPADSNEENINSNEGNTNSNEENIDSNGNNVDSNEDKESTGVESTSEFHETTGSPTESPTESPTGPFYVYTELRGMKYWLNVNKTYIILFSVLTGSAIIVFYCVAIRRRNNRIN